MEGYQREFEAEAWDDEGNCYDKHGGVWAFDNLGGDVVEIEAAAAQGVCEADAKQQDGRWEDCRHYVFDGCFVALIAVFVEGNHCCQGQWGAFQADDEEQEMTGRNHQIHAEECYQQQLKELAAAYGAFLAVYPLLTLQYDQEDA